MADNENKNKKGKSSAKRTGTAKQRVIRTGKGLFYGDLISSSFFNRYKFTIIITIGLLMVYITIKYECQTHMETIAKLEKELTIVKTESIREQSTYKSRTRESDMQQRIDSLHLSLKLQDKPPYKLKY